MLETDPEGTRALEATDTLFSAVIVRRDEGVGRADMRRLAVVGMPLAGWGFLGLGTGVALGDRLPESVFPTLFRVRKGTIVETPLVSLFTEADESALGLLVVLDVLAAIDIDDRVVEREYREGVSEGALASMVTATDAVSVFQPGV